MDTKERGWIVFSFRSQYKYERPDSNSSEKNKIASRVRIPVS